MRGRIPDGPVLLFDDDAFYIGSVMAEVLRAAGREVVYVTPDDVVASWTTYTQEYRHVQKRLRSLGMQIVTGHNISRCRRRRRAARVRIQRPRAARGVRVRRRRHRPAAERQRCRRLWKRLQRTGRPPGSKRSRRSATATPRG